MRFVYVLLAHLLVPLMSAALLWRGLRDRSYWRNFGERFGFGPGSPEPGIWVHAASFGEVQAASALVHALRARYPHLPLIVTSMTPAGIARARVLFKEGVLVRYLPFDLPGSVRRFFDRVRPRIAIVFETELWPNLYHECGRRRVPLVLASARVSPRSVHRYRWLASLFREALANDVVIGAQGTGDAERFRAIGASASRTHVTGNIKFDFLLPPDTAGKGRALRERHAPARPLWVAGSTHAGEEELVLQAHRRVRETHPGALLALVPRHSQRFADVAALLERTGIRFTRRSSGTPCAPEDEVLLVDTLGELLDFYAAGDVAFVGGSLVPVGGHNLLEPAALAMPVLTGPHNFNAQDVAQLLLAQEAAQTVSDAPELGEAVARLLSDPRERARVGAIGRTVVESNRGALAKILRLVEPLL